MWAIIVAVAKLWHPADFQQTMTVLCHATNIFLHGLCGIMVYRILRRKLRFSATSAMLGALLFVVHPLQVESIAWISSLRGLLSTFFSLLCIDCMLSFYDRNEISFGGRVSRHVLSFFTYALAVLSKPSAVVNFSNIHCALIPTARPPRRYSAGHGSPREPMNAPFPTSKAPSRIVPDG